MHDFRPTIVGIGGTDRHGSSTERAVECALESAQKAGAKPLLIGGSDLKLPLYSPASAVRTEAARKFVRLVSEADGLIIASPGYHGSVSGLMKNALDYIEDLREGPRVYIDGIAVGCIACSEGPQAASGTLSSLRSIVHSLRGWPTPMGVAITSPRMFGQDGKLLDCAIHDQIVIMTRQVVDFALMRRHRQAEPRF